VLLNWRCEVIVQQQRRAGNEALIPFDQTKWNGPWSVALGSGMLIRSSVSRFPWLRRKVQMPNGNDKEWASSRGRRPAARLPAGSPAILPRKTPPKRQAWRIRAARPNAASRPAGPRKSGGGSP
jgi:hypothetical protein